MKIAIVVINWNGLELLKKYLKKIVENSPDQNIYVIDNNSKDKMHDIEKPITLEDLTNPDKN